MAPTKTAAERLAELKARREQAHAENYKATKAEDASKKVNPRDEARQQRRKREALEEQQKLDMEEAGVDYKRAKAMEKTVSQAEWELDEKEKAKRREVLGFSDFEDVALRKYKRLTSALKPDLVHYVEQKLEQGDDFYRDANSLVYGLAAKPDKQRLNAFVEDLRQQEQTRLNARKAKKFDPNADVDYINDRNRRFNEKISRAFDTYTQEIKDNLERGTAL